MAQLPPKVPSMAQNWPSFSNYQMPSSAAQPPNWVDDFLDFSSVRRNSHRRSVSDPIAFIESPFIDECRNSGGGNTLISSTNNIGFDRLDDEQFSSMFPDDVATTTANPPSTTTRSSSSNPSTPSSDQNNDDQLIKPTDQQQPQQPKNEPAEVEDDISTGQLADQNHETEAGKPCFNFSSEANTIVDPKRVKRILANRQSAQRSRVRKLQYISELERSVTSLQTEVSALSPRVAFLDHQRLVLNVDNSALKQRIAALAQDKIFKDAHQEALKNEIERLRKVYHEQTLQKTANNDDDNNNNEDKMIRGGNDCSAAVNRGGAEGDGLRMC
uniref:basic leucine zipper 34-like n=1 Tax=Erigeron canadensis TaxID=72917 RepID=UPI001CB92840|nr:basic leucine zipper 34-like [Erigeron canadensis]